MASEHPFGRLLSHLDDIKILGREVRDAHVEISLIASQIRYGETIDGLADKLDSIRDKLKALVGD